MSHRVLVWGVFDLLHDGHKGFLHAAKAYGDELYVIVVPDDIVKISKQHDPIQSEVVRKEALLALDDVTGAAIDSFQLGFQSVDRFAPDVVCFGYDQNREWADKFMHLLAERNMHPEVIWINQQFGDIHTSQLRKDS